MDATEVRHPLFARFFDQLSKLMEREAGKYRRELLAGLSGRVVEVGVGNGINFRHYPGSVSEVIAVEPEPYMRRKAQDAADAAAVRVTVHDSVAAPLQLDSASCDAAVASLVLCSVPDPSAALDELHRVLKPGGELRFMEHVRSPESSKARVQRFFDRSGMWPRMAGGCHCARDTVSLIERAGFDVTRVRAINIGPSWAITNPHMLGSASAGSAGDGAAGPGSAGETAGGPGSAGAAPG